MAVLPIRTLGDPGLRTAADAVERFDAALAKLAADMVETMQDAPGVGLAAPQVGVPRRLFVFESGEEGGAVANPRIAWRSEETQEGDEGCLSIPGVFFPVVRAMSVRLEGQDLAGEPIVREATGFLARIFQHETDHVDGILFLDRLTTERRREAMRLIREQQLGTAAPPPGTAKAL